jgi:hypothetical protein
VKLWTLALAGALAALCSLSAPAEPVNFANEVHPILVEKCYKCHAGDRRKGGLKLDSLETLQEGGETGPAAVVGKHAESLLFQRVTSTNEDDRMPPEGDPLTPEQADIIARWIDEGLHWEEEAFKPKGYIAPLALQPVTKPNTPNLIDGFIDQYLAEKGVPQPEQLSDALFLRRAYLDVSGLLPTEDALKDFIKDRSADKRARIVDALLASNQAYAEHWITFWNDLLRNDFEGTGYIDGGRSTITDWLYEALLENRPYDKFVTELIDPRPSSQGFIKGIVWRGDNATVQLPAMQASANVSQVFLGVNMKCAMCHDSFVNHWKLADAFGLANAFSETPMEMVRCDTPTGEAAPYQFIWPELGTIDGSASLRERQKRVAELVTTPANGFFTRTIVNRLWALLFGRGLVEPVDAIEGEPWHPALLDALAQDLIDHGYDLKHTLRVMMTSKAYGWRSVTTSPAADAPFVFAGPIVRRLSAEEFYDALARVTDVWLENPKFLKPEERKEEKATGPVRAWRLSSDTLTRAMGRTNRETVTTRRDTSSTTLQFLELTNGATLARQVKRSAEKIAKDFDGRPRQLVLDLYRRGLQRAPSSEELELAAKLMAESTGTEGVEDLLWTMIMLPEFQLVY